MCVHTHTQNTKHTQDIEPFLTRVRDAALRHSLAYGVGLLTETLSEAEKALVQLLFESGAIQVGFLYLYAMYVSSLYVHVWPPRSGLCRKKPVGDTHTHTHTNPTGPRWWWPLRPRAGA